MTVTVLHGDCLEILPTLDAESIDTVVTDPPYEIGFMSRKWDKQGVAFRSETWQKVFRVLKPGAHLLAFGGTRTYHRMVCAIEDAGFEIRDCILWLHGQGFPKNRNISAAIDLEAGAEREVVEINKNWGKRPEIGPDGHKGEWSTTAPATEDAKKWQGWGTALKPAVEMICVARKPLSERTIAANVLKHGTGGVNIGGCIIKTDENRSRMNNARTTGTSYIVQRKSMFVDPVFKGRWPANLVHDGSEEVLSEFKKYGEKSSHDTKDRGGTRGDAMPVVTKFFSGSKATLPPGRGDTGTAARFFYTAKADKDDRLKSKHPTVKPVSLVRWLVRLVTPPEGRILDPFAGSGTTGMACMAEGFDCVLIEREAEYVRDIQHRLKHVKGDDLPLFAEPPDQGTLL